MRTALFALPVLLAVAACSGDDDSGSDGSATGATTACSADKRGEQYTPGMAKPASDLKVAIVQSAFTPKDKPVVEGQVQKGMNTITVEVRDANDGPVDGVALSLDLWMPDHAHGSALPPKVTPLGGGRYEIKEVWLPMAGLWRFTIGVTATGAQPKSTEFNFCLEG